MTFDDSQLGAHLGDRMRAIARYLHDAGCEVNVLEIAAQLDLPYNGCCICLRRLTRHGITKNPRRGYYRIDPAVTHTSYAHGSASVRAVQS